MTPHTYDVADVAQMLGKSPEWVADRARRREFPHLRVGNSIRFTDTHVAQILTLLEQPAGTPQPGPLGLTPRSRIHKQRRRAPRNKTADTA